jgi:hypothetical protein
MNVRTSVYKKIVVSTKGVVTMIASIFMEIATIYLQELL